MSKSLLPEKPKQQQTMVREHIGKLVLFVSSFMIATSAHAEGQGMFGSLYDTFTQEIGFMKDNMLAMFGAAILVLIGLAVWRYTKRSVNSA